MTIIPSIIPSKKRCNKQLGKNSAKTNNSQYRIQKFTKILKKGPIFVCVICNRCLYARTALSYDPEKYDTNMAKLAHQVSACQKSHICKSCHSSLKKSQISAKAVSKLLEIFLPQDELKSLKNLKHRLTSLRILITSSHNVEMSFSKVDVLHL